MMLHYDSLKFGGHAHKKIDGIDGVDVDYLFGRLVHQHGDLYFEGHGRYELYLPDLGIAIKYQVEIEHMRKHIQVITVFEVTDPHHRYHRSDRMERVDR